MRPRLVSALPLSLLCSTVLCTGVQAQQPAPAVNPPGAVTRSPIGEVKVPSRGDTTLLASREKTAPFEIKEGDRVLLLGDALLERENTYGYLETRMHEQFPDRSFTVRNLSWSGDTPAGWSRASFDPPEKGMERLKEQIAMVKPTVVFLGYGMAASLQEITDRSRDWTLNPDPARYGREPMTAARFKKELGELMDVIGAIGTAEGAEKTEKGKPTGGVRFVLLSPIRHEDLREARPGLPDAAEHNKLLEQYSKAVDELATVRNAMAVSCAHVPIGWGDPNKEHLTKYTDNGIHLNQLGWAERSSIVAGDLGWRAGWIPLDRHQAEVKQPSALRAAVLRKNDLFFHRFRPANSTYLFGFRKHEQGQNAKEMDEFEPFLKAADAEIDRLKRASAKAGGKDNTTANSTPPKVSAIESNAARRDFAKAEPLPSPTFDVQEGYEISLWAEAPLLGKPTEMAWDADGRLWVTCTPIYPQIEPGAHPDDKVVILEDTDHDGKADKSTTFAGDLLIPTGVAPDISTGKGAAAYIAASTEIFRLEDTDGDGRADSKRVVLSGFGTEDTHHNVHTLRWGPDGRLYFNQSVYPHTHLETPWGMVRLNAGGVFAYDPRTERVEVFCKGLWNPWGHAWDRWGQSFLTDGAGFAGMAWAFPGAVFAPSEGARKTMPTISPGNYPKFAGLEIVQSPLFPEDWQGTAVTCDFRAHRIVRFAIEDLSEEKTATTQRTPRKEETPPQQSVAPVASSRFTSKSGYVTRELPDIARTADLAFRPIDVKLGPDGALYIADWTNPVINHGEVDFRDPRRDHVHGRIWRVAPKGKKLSEKIDVAAVPRAPLPRQESLLERVTTPRARIEAMRSLARHADVSSVEQILSIALNTPKEDPYYEFAAWRSINDLADVWVEAVLKGEWKPEGKEKQLEYALGSIEPELSSKVLRHFVSTGKVPFDGSGPWLELLGRAGDAASIQRLWDPLLVAYAGDCCETDETRALGEKVKAFPNADVAKRAMAALVEAARTRSVRPAERSHLATALFHAPEPLRSGAVELAGLWKAPDTVEKVGELLSDQQLPADLRRTIVGTLRAVNSPAAFSFLEVLTRPDQPLDLRCSALVAIAQLKLDAGIVRAAEVFPDLKDEALALKTWQQLVQIKGAPEALTTRIARSDAAKNYPPAMLKAALRASREQGKKTEGLTTALAALTGATTNIKSGIVDQGAINALLGSIRNGGDPAEGERIYHRVALACTTCHAIGGAGGKLGPDLTSLGASAPPDYIVESLLAPAAKVKENYHAFSYTMRDGTSLSGIPSRETDKELYVRPGPGPEVPLVKANIVKREPIDSLMPASLIDPLNPTEKRALLTFLTHLGKPGPFDASKGNVARTWWLHGTADASKVLAGTAGGGMAAFTYIDGRLDREKLAQTATLVSDGPVLAMTKLQTSVAGKVKLDLLGIREAWLDGQALPVASEPSPTIELAAGTHTLVVKLDAKQLPEAIRAAASEGRFLTE